jgi:rRNA maturation protein Nop10
MIKLSLKKCSAAGCYLNACPDTCTVCGRRVSGGYPRHSVIDPVTREWRTLCCPCVKES